MLDEHTDLTKIEAFLAPLATGAATGVLSEAGCPAVADPGAAIVALAHKKGFRVIPLAGPSSIIMALMASGFNGQNFAFNGYLPAKPDARVQRIKQLRNMQLLSSLLSSLKGETKLCIAAGITCGEEYIRTKSVSEWKKSPLPEINKIPAIFLLYA